MVVLAVTGATWFIAHAGWLDGFETASLDALLLFEPRLEAKHLVVVEITDEDYATLFHETSPLDASQLRHLLVAIARGKPGVVGIDLEADPPQVAGAPSSPDDPEQWPPTVWALGTRRAGHEAAGSALGVPIGVPALPVDGDGVIRRYWRQIPGHDGDSAPTDSLQWAMAKVYCAAAPGDPGCERLATVDPEEDLVLNFAGDRFDFRRMTAESLMEASKGEAWRTPKGPLFGRIVLLGGLYHAARDEHFTPLGQMAGVYIVSQAIESELQGRGIRPLNRALMLLMELLGGFAIVLLHHWLSARGAFWTSLVGVPALAGASSFIAFHSLSRWMSFAPVLIAMLLHELYEGRKHAEALETGR